MQTTKTTGAVSLKERQRQEREDLILQVAEEVFMEKGYYDASMDEIAHRVGIAKSTIYTHFPGKEELVFALIQRDAQKFQQHVATLLEVPKSPRARLEALMQLILTGVINEKAQLLASMYNGVDLKKIVEEKNGCMGGLMAYLVPHICELLEAGKEAGEFKRSLPTQAMLCAFFNTISPRSYERLLATIATDDLSRQELVASLQIIYFNGIADHKTDGP